MRDNSIAGRSDSASPAIDHVCDSTDEVIPPTLETETQDILPATHPSSALEEEPAKESGRTLDSLNISGSSLESVSIDGSLHSGDTLVLRGDVLAQEQDLSPRDDANVGHEEEPCISGEKSEEIPASEDLVDEQGLTEAPVTGGDNEAEVKAETGEEDGGMGHESHPQHTLEEQQSSVLAGVDTYEQPWVSGEGDSQSRWSGKVDKNAFGGQGMVSSAFPSDAQVTVTQSAQNVSESAQNVSESAQNVSESVQSVSQSALSVTQSAQSVTQSAQNVSESAQNVSESVQSVSQSALSVTQSAQSVTQSAQNVSESAQSVTQSAQNVSHLALSVTQSAQSNTQSVHSLEDPLMSTHGGRDNVQVSEPTGRGNEEDGAWQNEPAQLYSQSDSAQRHPDFPFNYNNYKVCRQVEPGVKECLILETGEHVTCRKPPSPVQVTSQSSDEDDSASPVNFSSGNHTPERRNSETGPENQSPKSGFKIIHKNEDGTLRFSNLILNATDTPSQEVDKSDDEECQENVLEGSPKLDLRNRSSSEPLSPRGVKNSSTRSPRLGSGNSSTNAVSPRDNHSARSAVEGSRVERGSASSPGKQSPRSSSESSSARDSAGIRDLADLGTVQDIYETESDLRPGLEGDSQLEGDGYHHYTRHSSTYDTRHQTCYREAVQDTFPVISPRPQEPSLTSQQDKIDMSALYRAERWLDERNARTSASPQRPNLSTSVSSTGSGPIPGFRTLQEQQASWMKMFKLLEDQHQSDLLTQYKQHQRNIQHLQEQIEDDLCRQQDSFQKKLDVHRELLLHNSSFAGSYIPADFVSEGSEASEVTGRRTASLPRPFIRDDDDNDTVSEKLVSASALLVEDSRLDDLLLEPSSLMSRQKVHGSTRSHQVDMFEDGSPRIKSNSRSAVRDDVSSRVHGDGMYSASHHLTSSSLQFSPVTKQVRSSSLRGAQDDVEDLVHSYVSDPRHSLLLHDTTIRSHQAHLHPVSPPAGEGNTSANARVSLREKHAKHLSDLRSYYEQELQELRAALTSPEYIKSQSPYKQVMEVNLELQGRVEVQEDEISALKRANRELESKVHTLQSRLDDTLEKYEESQVTLGAVRRQLDEVQVLCTEKDSLVKHLEADNSRLSTALSDAYKIQDQQIAEAKREEAAMKRLAERHDNLNRENESNKEALSQMDAKLYDSRMEIVQLKRMISKLELENNRLGRENNNLRHKGLISSLGLSTFYPQSGQESGLGESMSPQTSHYPMESRCVSGQPSPDMSEILSDNEEDVDLCLNGEPDVFHSPPRTNQSPSQGRDVRKSPLVKAEEDLRTLRRTVKENLGQSLAQQRSFPRSSRGPGRGVEQRGSNSRSRSPSMSLPSSSNKSSPNNGVSSSQISSYATQHVGSDPTTIIDTLMSRSTPQRKLFTTNVDRHLPTGGTPTRFDIDIRPAPSSRAPSSSKKRTSPVKKDKAGTKLQQSNKDMGVNSAVESTLEKMRAGEFVTRPSWENRDTTTVRGGKAAQPGGPKHREEKIQERVRAIHDLEVKYDDLQVEKRQLESALSKVPLHGKVNHHNRKAKEDLDNQLDKVEKELGSIRMSLKRYHVLKTSSH
ncbi:uncharacterized protein LOC135476575 [Liolophura sinensis]|uniref:uncharacterized protein LOC135476575 n=1 Tax=Liolophura sinensis TaxID=3198878 RepID=UPI003157FD15